ncbi:MAG: hypothetical protein MUC48_05450 [Leptolyngbya sp. Prado105]|jgi:hypothetical protein|nr:hypothetical protein [Leptolyngbya sp. Prado105]
MKRLLILSLLTLFLSSPALAQSSRPNRIQEAWQQVYKDNPNLPLENQYVNRETGKVDPNNTLVSRLIRYHYFIKGRPVSYRLDWKYTIADFLGMNDIMQENTYPGAENLRKNPFESDRAIIQNLNRKQREALIQSLVNVFTPR